MNKPTLDRATIDADVRRFFEDLWGRGDPWELETSDFEQRRYARLAELLGARRFARILEIGCGAGAFTRRLAGIADHVLALDISETAIARARHASAAPPNVEFRVANVMEYDVRTGGPWDLIVMAETIYYLGWRYPFFDVGWLASELHAATSPGGRLLLANTRGGCDDALVLPWLIDTYRDLFRNVGYQVEAEDVFRGPKDGIPLEVLITLFHKPYADLDETTHSR